MVAVSPFFATTRLLNEIRSVRTRAEEAQPEQSTQIPKRAETAPAPKTRRKPK